MIRIYSLIGVLVVAGCTFRPAAGPSRVSYAFPDGQIALGGLPGEQFLGTAAIDSSWLPRPSVFTGRVALLEEKLWRSGADRLSAPVWEEWREMRDWATEHHEELSGEDIRAWVALNDSLLKLTGEVPFADELERIIYGVPVADVLDARAVRSFACTRMLDKIYINLLGSLSVEHRHTTGGIVRIVQDTDYPFDGRILLKVETDDTRYLDLYIRIPSWAENCSVTMKGVRYNAKAGAYTEIARKWKSGQEVEVVIGGRPDWLNGSRFFPAISRKNNNRRE